MESFNFVSNVSKAFLLEFQISDSPDHSTSRKPCHGKFKANNLSMIFFMGRDYYLNNLPCQVKLSLKNFRSFCFQGVSSDGGRKASPKNKRNHIQARSITLWAIMPYK